MEWMSSRVFLPLMLMLLAASFCDGISSRILKNRRVAVLEEKLAVLRRYEGLAIGACMLLGAFARCYRFVELPMGINQDGLMAGTEALCLMRNGTDQFGTSWPTYFEAWGFSQMSTLYSYLLIPFFAILGVSKFTLRLPMLLVSMAALPLIWDLARRVAGRGYALAALFLVATNPWHMIQSRWALEANLMPHVMLLGVYLLVIGLEKRKRWALYLSMVVFGLAPYAYGVACFSVSAFLAGGAIFCFARKKVGLSDLVVCMALFIAVAGPYFYTMAINAFGWETVHLGPFTLPQFEQSKRTNDLIFSKDNPYYTMLNNVFEHLSTWVYVGREAAYSCIPWAFTLYPWMPPVVLAGIYLMWKNRRNLARLSVDCPQREGAMLLMLWLAAALFNGAMIGGVVNRNNIVFYPLILMGGYALVEMGKRMRVCLAATVVMVLIGFAGLNVTYFTDRDYQNEVGDIFSNGQYEALRNTWNMAYDRYYVNTAEADAHRRFMQASLMFAHEIDYQTRAGHKETVDALGRPTGQTFDERYVFMDLAKMKPDPSERAVYVFPVGYTSMFDPTEFVVENYRSFAAAYPRRYVPQEEE